MNNFSKIIISVLAIGLIAAVIYGVVQHRLREKAENQSHLNQRTVNQATRIINSYVDSSQRKHAVIAADENILPPNWTKNGIAISGGLVDTVAQALNIAKNKLQQITQIATTTQAENLQAKRTIDSLKRLVYSYRDKYVQMTYRPALPGADSADNGQFDFKYNDSLNVVQYWKKKWFLGAKKSYIDIYSNDPRTTVNGVKRLVVEQRSPVFGLRVQGVSSYSFSRKLLNVGPGVQFDIGKFSLVGTYYYDFDASKFRPSVGARYDFVRF